MTFSFSLLLPGGGLSAIALAHLMAAKPKLALVSESFTDTNAGVKNGTVLPLTPDNGNPIASWDELAWFATTPNVRAPLALVAGHMYNLEVGFSIDNPLAVLGRLNRLTFTGTSDFLFRPLLRVTPTVTLESGGIRLWVVWKGLLAPAKASVNDEVDEQWTVGGIPNVALQASGTAKHQIYVLPGMPTGPEGTKLYHTVVRVGTLAAQGLSATTDADKLQISAAIVRSFESLKITRADNPVVLTYYGKWTVAAPADAGTRSTAKLLATGDGNCNAWSNFFMDVVQAQGVTLGDTAKRLIAVNPKAPLDPATFPNQGFAQEAPVMLVKNWAVSPNAKGLTLIRADQVDLGKRKYLFVDAKGNPEPNPNLEVGKSIACQGGTPNPLAYFTDHQAVEISIADASGNAKTILFDPSYGTEAVGKNDKDADGRLLAWQNQSLDFIGVLYNFIPNRDVRVIVVQSITKDTTKFFVDYFVPQPPKK